tara:strand:+ start:1273 stop:1857 length:585 start_codon:yes stop_codon:yes gene_type:complete
MDLSTICQQLILASSSKSRIEHLEREKIDFEVRPHKIDESIIKKKKTSYLKIVEELAEAKAHSVVEKENEFIIGSDQILVCEEKLIDKPKTVSEAKSNLLFLKNKEHKLISSIAVIYNEIIIFRETKEAKLKMKNISEVDIDAYLSKNIKTALSCVGSYKIEENKRYNFLEVIHGDMETIIGFPVNNFIEKIRK